MGTRVAPVAGVAEVVAGVADWVVAGGAADVEEGDAELVVAGAGEEVAVLGVLVGNSVTGLTWDFDAAMIGGRVREDGLPAAGDRGVVARVAGEVLLVQGRRNTRAPARGRGTAADGSPALPVLD